MSDRPTGSQRDDATADAARSDFADALRALALVGIFIVNLPYVALPESKVSDPSSGPDTAALVLIMLFFEGKFFLLFSFLFGFGFVNQMRRIAEGGATLASYWRRLVGLFALGVLHAVLLFSGDILTCYAILGAALWLVRGWSDRRLVRLAIALVVLTALIDIGLSSGFGPADPERLAEDAEIATHAYRDGGFADAIDQRLYELGLIQPLIVLLSWPLMFAAFCFGMVAGRSGLLDAPQRLAAALRPIVWPLLVVAIPGNLAYAAIPWLPYPVAAAAFAVSAAAAPCLAALYVLGLVWMWERRGRARRVLERVAPAGRMSLSNYLGQSVLANVLFMGWGFGLFGQFDLADLLALAAVNVAALLGVSLLWLRRFTCGPGEWLLRSWTQLRWVRLFR